MLRFSIVEKTRPEVAMSRDSPFVVICWMFSVKRANGSVSDWEAEVGRQSPSLSPALFTKTSAATADLLLRRSGGLASRVTPTLPGMMKSANVYTNAIQLEV
jgi:hypothetical protein